MDSSLESLVVDESDLAQEELAAALRPYVRFTREGVLVPEPAFFDELSAELRVLCVLLALQALRMLGARESAAAKPGEIVELSGMAPGTVRPKLSSLAKSRRAQKRDGRYFLPVHAARRAIELLRSSSS